MLLIFLECSEVDRSISIIFRLPFLTCFSNRHDIEIALYFLPSLFLLLFFRYNFSCIKQGVSNLKKVVLLQLLIAIYAVLRTRIKGIFVGAPHFSNSIRILTLKPCKQNKSLFLNFITH